MCLGLLVKPRWDTTITTLAVHLASHGVKVQWIYTWFIPAEVVKFFPLRYGAYQCLVGEAVGLYYPTSLAIPEATMPFRFGTCPLPTAILHYADFLPESFR